MRFLEQNYPLPQSIAVRRSGRAMKQFAVGTFLTAFLSLLLAGTALAQTNLVTLYTFRGIQGDKRHPIGDLVANIRGRHPLADHGSDDAEQAGGAEPPHVGRYRRN